MPKEEKKGERQPDCVLKERKSGGKKRESIVAFLKNSLFKKKG